MFVNLNDKFHLLCDIVGVPADGEESQGGEACTKLLANMMIKIMIIFKIMIITKNYDDDDDNVVTCTEFRWQVFTFSW